MPIWVGGHSEPALARAARLADGWITVNVTAEEAVAGVERIRELRGGLDGFDVSALAVDVWDLDGWLRLADAGVTEVQVLPWYSHNDGGDPDSLDVRLASLARFADDVLARAVDSAGVRSVAGPASSSGRPRRLELRGPGRRRDLRHHRGAPSRTALDHTLRRRRCRLVIDARRRFTASSRSAVDSATLLTPSSGSSRRSPEQLRRRLGLGARP